MAEKKLKEKCQKILKKDFSDVWYFHPSDRYYSGIPDFIGCMEGYFWAIELKDLKGRVSKIQEYTIKKIQEAKGKAMVCYTADDFKRFLMGLRKWIHSPLKIDLNF